VRLTAAGEAALGPAREALVNAERVREAVRLGAGGESGRLRIGFVGSAVAECLPRVIPWFRQRFPQVEVELEEMATIDIAAALEARRIDVGLVRLPVMNRADLDIAVIERDVLMVGLPAEHPLAGRDALDLADLANEPFVVISPHSVLHTVVYIVCQQAGFKPRVAQEANQLLTVLSLVQSGLGVTLVPSRLRRFAPDSVKLIPLTDPVATDMGIACTRDAGPLIRNFVAAARDASDSGSISPGRK
jgi:DNA-binding transcriptional LysR family regulator